MSTVSKWAFRSLAAVFFLLAVGAILATLYFGSESGVSPGIFSAVILAGLGRWLWGKAEGKTAGETFGRAIEIKESRE